MMSQSLISYELSDEHLHDMKEAQARAAACALARHQASGIRHRVLGVRRQLIVVGRQFAVIARQALGVRRQAAGHSDA
jgi:hypothetical protein